MADLSRALNRLLSTNKRRRNGENHQNKRRKVTSESDSEMEDHRINTSAFMNQMMPDDDDYGVNNASTAENEQNNDGEEAEEEDPAKVEGGWGPYTPSADFVIFQKYGRPNPHRQCKGCELAAAGASNKHAIKHSNVETFNQRARDGLLQMNPETRLKIIERDYHKHIVSPKLTEKLLLKKKLRDNDSLFSLLGGERGQNSDCAELNRSNSGHSQSFHDAPHVNLPLPDGTHACSFGHETSYSQCTTEGDDHWHPADIHHHMTHHMFDPTAITQRLMLKYLKWIDDIENNSLASEHSTKKNAYGEPQKIYHPDQAKLIQMFTREIITLGKSRPDRWIPFTDPDAKTNATEVLKKQTNVIQTSSTLLY